MKLRINLAGFARRLWLAMAALVLVVFGAFLFMRAMQSDEDVRALYRESLLLAQAGFEAQLLLTELRGASDTRTVIPSLRRKLDEIARLHLTGAEQQDIGEVERAIAAIELDPGMQRRAALLQDSDRRLLSLVTSVRDRTESNAGIAHRFHDFALYSLLAVAVLTLAVAIVLVTVALRTLSAHRERLGQLDQMAHEDALTGVVNRRRLDETLPIELARAQRLGYPLSVAMLDLDFFKRYNDRRGHGAGDALLREAAQSWRRQLRPTDVLARYGGEEFTLVLPSCDAEQAEQLIERLRPLMPERQTFSAGVAVWDGQDSADGLLRTADIALLQAKRTGRNRTVVAGREPQIALPLRAVS
ncbi:MAG TPA: GGDEF domain-containing protein [Burkholderiaceae bacterium]|nr:GGDEF domain-containing protein [Burkholderiaceae bacterium]